MPVICNNDEYEIRREDCLVTYFEGQWHQVLWSKSKKRFKLGIPKPEFDAWNTITDEEAESTKEEQSNQSEEDDDEPSVDTIDEQIRAAPIPTNLRSPIHMSMSISLASHDDSSSPDNNHYNSTSPLQLHFYPRPYYYY